MTRRLVWLTLAAAFVVGPVGIVDMNAQGSTARTAAHPEPNDVDGDGVLNDNDNCPQTPNGNQLNTDGDTEGDACDLDDDNDGIRDYHDDGTRWDNCRVVHNPDQLDSDGDGRGDACPPVDTDHDGVVDENDNCPRAPNPTQSDAEPDGIGDPCDRDDDNDQVDDDFDNCRATWNPPPPDDPAHQPDADGDRIGDACDDTPLGPGGPAAPPTGSPGAQDRSAPRVTASIRARVARALVVSVRCSEACTLEATLRRGRTVLGRGRWALGASGRAFVFVRWTAAGRRARGRAGLTVVARDAAGNESVARRTVTLSR